MPFVSLFSKGLVASVAAFVGVATFAACSSSSDDASSAQASSCSQAKTVVDSCNSKQPADGGLKVTVNFDEAKCESGGDQGKKFADCIVANKDNCDRPAACGLKGSCP